jgi:hypothetical protein
VLGNNSVHMFPQQGKIVGGIVSNAVSVVSEKRMRLVLPRNYYSVLLSFKQLNNVEYFFRDKQSVRQSRNSSSFTEPKVALECSEESTSNFLYCIEFNFEFSLNTVLLLWEYLFILLNI